MQTARLLLLSLFCFFLAATAAVPQVQVSLSALGTGHPGLSLNFTVTNPSTTEAATILLWNTPLEADTWGRFFEIADLAGNPVAYTGKVARRVWPPAADDFHTLSPGSSLSAVIDLTQHFGFEVAGDYLIQFLAPGFSSSLSGVSAFGRSNVLRATLTPLAARIARADEKARRKNLELMPANTNCNSQENSQIASAVAGAKTESKAAYQCMAARTCDAAAKKWFGTYSAANFDYDKGVFQKVNARLNNYAFNAYCNPAGCGNNVFAYVYPTDSKYTVYLCGAFWQLPLERVNTVVHEMSHFNTLGGTDDYAYGQSACLNLAKSNPARASHNADNVCYFSEEVTALTSA